METCVIQYFSAFLVKISHSGYYSGIRGSNLAQPVGFQFSNYRLFKGFGGAERKLFHRILLFAVKLSWALAILQASMEMYQKQKTK